jgi:dTDP-4-amino-4,6-dideoxygalactose transaminase
VTTVPFLDLSRRSARLAAAAHASLTAVLDSGSLILGPSVRQFEREFAAYCGAASAVGVASGTDALALALEALGVGPGDEVITVANTCVPTVAAIRSTGATTTLVDPHPTSWTMDADALDAAIGSRTRAIVPVHLYGLPADVPAIRRVADAHGLVVVEDAAQAHGAAWGGVRAGALGHAAAFSFYPTKNLGAFGDGGMVTTDDPAVAATVCERRVYGLRDGVAVSGGRNSRLDELQAAFLGFALRDLEADNGRRRSIAARYDEAFAAGASLQLPVTAPEARPSRHIYAVAVGDRDAFRASLARAGIETMIHYPHALHEHPGLADVTRTGGSLSVSSRLARQVVSLPLYPELADSEVDRIIDAVLIAAPA